METITSTNTQALMMAKKAWKITTLIFQLLKKRISNAYLLKRGNELAGKAIQSLLLTLSHSHHEIYCNPLSRNDAARSFAANKEYEFSCSSSPAFQYLLPFSKRSKIRRRHHIDHRRCRYHVDEASVAAAVQRVFDMLNGEAAEGAGAGSAAATPMLLPGFGKSPAVPVRQLRVTDSPFPVNMNEEEAVQVSKAAEEFIRKFYGGLKREKSLAAFESPYHNHHHQH